MRTCYSSSKRLMAMVLAVVMMLSCAPLNVFAAESGHNHDPHASLGVLIKENVDGLSDEEVAIITSGILNADKTYYYQMPSDADNLISVDEETGTVTAKVYKDPTYGTVWTPKTFDLSDGHAAIEGYEDLPLTEKNGVYEGTYETVLTTPGNNFSVEVTYSLDLTISDEDMAAQQEMLDAPYALAQDIATLKYLNAVGVIGDDAELAEKIVELSDGLIKDPTKIYASTILEFMAMDLAQLGNQSAIDMIYQLVEGYEVPVVTEIDFENGKIVTENQKLGLRGNDGKKAATNLYNQKKDNNALALTAFLAKYSGISYLEMITKHGAELEAALNSNFADFDYLANSTRGLQDVSDEVAFLIEDYNAVAEDIYAELNDRLEAVEGVNVTVNSLQELQALIAQLETLDDQAYAAIDAELQKLDAATKWQLSTLGVTLPEKVEDAEDLEALKVALVTAYTAALAQVNSALASLDDATKLMLKTYGAPDTIRMADTSSYESFTKFGDKDIQDLTALENALNKAETAALAQANAKLQAIYADASMKTMLMAAGAPATIATSQDLTKLQSALESVKTTLMAQADAKLQQVYADVTMKTMLMAAGAPATIATTQDLTKLQTALTNVKATLLAQADAKLQEIYADTSMKTMLMAAGAPATIATTQDLPKLQNALANVKANLLAQGDAKLQAIYADASMKAMLVAAGAPEAVATVEDLTALQNALANVKANLLAQANAELQGMDASVKAQLVSKGAPATIEKAEDLTALKNALNAVYAEALESADASLKANLATLPAMVANMLPVKEIKSKADVEALVNYINGLSGFMANMVPAEIKTSLNSAKAMLDLLDTAIESVSAAETVVLEIEAAEEALNTAATALTAIDGAMTTLATASTAVATLDSAMATLDQAVEGVTALDSVKTTLDQAVEAIAELDSAKATLDQAVDALAELTDVKNKLATVKSALQKVKPYIGTALEAQEQLALLNNTYLPMAKLVESGFIRLEEGLAELTARKQQLDMLIMVMQAFCSTVKPANDAFLNDAYQAPALINANANPNYATLTALADGLAQADHDAVNPLHVTETVVRHQVDMYDVTVEYQAEVINPTKVDSLETVELATKSYTITMRKGATPAEILAELALVADEAAILSAWAISADNYDRATTTLPDALTEDITYVISYAPKMLTVSFGAGYEDGTADVQVPYGFRMTLPALDDVTSEYTYTVNGTSNLDQGTVVTITENTQISRELGAASAKQYLTDLVINTDPDMDQLVKNILQNEALNRGQAISIRVPGKEQVSVVTAQDASSTTITALPYGSRVGDKNWIAKTAIIDGVTVNMVDGIYVEINNPGFDEVVVNYQLAITAAALGITDEQLLAVMNTPYELVTDYKFQKSQLTVLASQEIMDLLTMLNATDTIEAGGQVMTLKEALGKVEGLNDLLGLGLTQKAIDAAKALYNIIPDAGYVPLYYTLQAFNEQGMIHYYKNETTYISQITELNNILVDFTNDPGIMALIPANKMSVLTSIQETLGNAATLAQPANKVNTDLINISSPYLNTLLGALDAAVGAELTHYTAAPGELIWTAAITQPGPSKRTATMTVNFNGAQKTVSKTVGFGETLAYADMTAWAQTLATELGLSNEIANYYNVSYSFSGDVIAGNDVELSATWTLRDYEVMVEGQSIGTVNYEDRQITLVEHSNANFQYKYYINNVLYGAGTHTLTLAQFKALTEGNLVITRETVNLTEAALIKLVDSMNGAAVLTKDANGEYAIVLRVDPETLMDSASNFAIGLVMTDYKYIGLGGETFFDGKFHMQALVDVIMDSGIGTESLLKLIDKNGNITSNLTLDGVVLNTVKPAYMNALGGVVLETSMNLGADANNTTDAKFYITLAGSVSELVQVRNALESAKDLGMSFVLADGKANVSAQLPDQAYGAYLAALSLVGETDVHDIEAVNAQVALGYLISLVEPVMDQNVTINTISNTLKKLGVDRDVTKYGSYFDLAKSLVDLDKITYTEDTATLPVENININALVHRLQNRVDNMELPAGISIDLSKLIYEYDDPNTTADDDTAGLDAAAAVQLTNLSTDYAALYLDVRAEGVLNKFGMWTEEELLAGADDFAGVSVIVLVDDVTGDLNINTQTVLDLNGKTLKGNIVGGKNANVIVIDNAYTSDVPGTVDGTVSGNVTILEGKVTSDVSAHLYGGYAQDNDGVVYNKLYTVTKDNDTYTVTLNATPGEIKELANKQGLLGLAMEIAAGLAINHYNVASFACEDKMIFDVQLDDIVNKISATNKLDMVVDTALSWVSASDLADLANMIIADLTDFAALEAALLSDGKVASYTFATAPWALEVEHITNGDYLTVSLGAADTKKEATMNVVITGSLQEELAQVAGALADRVTVDVEVDMEDIVRDSNSVINVVGTAKGVIEVDFTQDPEYIVLMAAIMADNATGTLKTKLINSIEEFYKHNSLYAMEQTFKAMTAQQFCDSLRNFGYGENFATMVNGLGLSAESKAGILAAIGDDELGYSYILSAVAFALRQLDARDLLETITDSGRTLGSLEKTDAIGKYFGFTRDLYREGQRGLIRNYKLGYELDVTEVAVKVRLFTDHVHTFKEIVDDQYLKSEATCTEAAVYYKSCEVCGVASTSETFTYGTANGHKLVEVVDAKYLKSEATCTEAAVYYKSCEVCGEASTETFTYGTANGHKLVEVADAKYLKSEATCTEAAVYYKSCEVCGEASTTETFTYGTANGHKLVEVVDAKYLKSEATCETAAVYYKSCEVCGEASTETFTYGTANGHKLVEVVDAKYLKSEATYFDPAVYYKSCEACGEASTTETFTYGEPLACPDPVITGVAGKVDGVTLYGWKTAVENNTNLLFLDVKAEGITQAELESILTVNMDNDADGIAAVTVHSFTSYNGRNLIATGTKITLEAENVKGVKATKDYIVIIMGDANCNGRTEAGDAIMMTNHFYGTNLLTGYALLAADINCNGRIEAGDARKNQVKYLDGSSTDAIKYVTALK